MTQMIKNLGQFAKALEPKVIATLELVAQDVKIEINEALERYYTEYDPSARQAISTLWYDRTEQLKDCCKIGKPKVVGNTISIEIYLDIDSLDYDTKGADPFKTVVAANAGLHGGWDVSHFASGQVTWGSISDNDGSSWGSGTQIWEEPMQELFGNGKLITLFKKHAKARGLNLR